MKEILKRFRNVLILGAIGVCGITCVASLLGGVGGGEQRSQTPSPEPTNPPAPLNTSLPTVLPTRVPVPTTSYRPAPSLSQGNSEAPYGVCSEVGSIRRYKGFVLICSKLCGSYWVQQGTACIDVNGRRTIP